MTDTFVIAEAGVNHNGDEALALDLVDVAAAAGADAVKFQTFRADDLATHAALKADYQLRNTGESESQHAMLRRLELSPDLHTKLAERCRAKSIAFMSTPFDPGSMRFLVSNFRMPFLKIPSGEVTNPLMLLAAAKTGLPVILSTGMADLQEVETALGVLAFGFSGTTARPSLAAFRSAIEQPDARRELGERVIVLHCTTEYPAPIEDANLRAMDTIRDTFGVRVGYSDHTSGMVASIAAVARGAAVIEKHFTLRRSLPGPDHAASLEPRELGDMIASIRQVERALGSGIKEPSRSEQRNLAIARKSLVASTSIARGEILTERNLTVKRPGSGISPMDYFERLGTPAVRDYAVEDLI